MHSRTTNMSEDQNPGVQLFSELKTRVQANIEKFQYDPNLLESNRRILKDILAIESSYLNGDSEEKSLSLTLSLYEATLAMISTLPEKTKAIENAKMRMIAELKKTKAYMEFKQKDHAEKRELNQAVINDIKLETQLATFELTSYQNALSENRKKTAYLSTALDWLRIQIIAVSTPDIEKIETITKVLENSQKLNEPKMIKQTVEIEELESDENATSTPDSAENTNTEVGAHSEAEPEADLDLEENSDTESETSLNAEEKEKEIFNRIIKRIELHVELFILLEETISTPELNAINNLREIITAMKTELTSSKDEIFKKFNLHLDKISKIKLPIRKSGLANESKLREIRANLSLDLQSDIELLNEYQKSESEKVELNLKKYELVAIKKLLGQTKKTLADQKKLLSHVSESLKDGSTEEKIARITHILSQKENICDENTQKRIKSTNGFFSHTDTGEKKMHSSDSVLSLNK